MENPVKIIIVDDHPLFREGIRLLIEKENIGEVIGVAENGQIFLQMLDSHDPDLVLMDIEMPVMDGLEATRRAKVMRPDLKVLMLTMVKEMDQCTRMIEAGAMGFVHKTSEQGVLDKAIRTVMSGENYFSIEVLRSLVASSGNKEDASSRRGKNGTELTDRELEVLRYFCRGYTVSEIADKIYRSVKTVEAIRSKLLEKTNSRNTLNLVLYAIRNKLAEV